MKYLGAKQTVEGLKKHYYQGNDDEVRYFYDNSDVSSALKFAKEKKRKHALGHHVARLPLKLVYEYMQRHKIPPTEMNVAIHKMLTSGDFKYFMMDK